MAEGNAEKEFDSRKRFAGERDDDQKIESSSRDICREMDYPHFVFTRRTAAPT